MHSSIELLQNLDVDELGSLFHSVKAAVQLRGSPQSNEICPNLVKFCPMLGNFVDALEKFIDQPLNFDELESWLELVRELSATIRELLDISPTMGSTCLLSSTELRI